MGRRQYPLIVARSGVVTLLGTTCIVLGALSAGGCSSNPGMVVDLRTDFVPGVEFHEVRTRVSRGGLPATEAGWTNTELLEHLGINYIDGEHVADYSKIGKGLFAVRVELLDGAGRPVAQGRELVEVKTATQAVTVVITRDCRGVQCPGAGDSPSSVACLGGRCVDPQCTPETPQYCPMPACMTAADCAPRAACATAQCVTGVGTCVYRGDDSMCAAGQYCDPDRGCVSRPPPAGEGGVPEGGLSEGGSDAGVDAGPPDPCVGVVCTGYTICVAGTCQDLPGCATVADCPTGDVCQTRHCIPGDADLDGDGVPASMDCDETNPAVHEGAMEVCDGLDDDCDMMIDEGDPGLLCASDPSGGVCLAGLCGCPAGTYDFDHNPTNGCECTAMPDATMGGDCPGAIDLGDVSDSGQSVTVSGNVLPDDREVWYHFHAVDTADTSCDAFHVRVQFTADPDNRFELTVFRGDCGTPVCDDNGYTDFSWATDFRDDTTGTGQCPCAPLTSGMSQCLDDSADFYVRVRRRMGSTVDCMGYSLEISNGVYHT